MDDLEITRACAEAMGIALTELDGLFTYPHPKMAKTITPTFRVTYDPLHDDAQAMALVKKFEIMWSSAWSAYTFLNCDEDGTPEYSYSDNLNRAICECAAKMQKAKHG